MQSTIPCPTLDPAVIKRAWVRAGDSYQGASVLQREIANRLLARLEFMRIQPACVLDCGARTGYTTQALAAHYPDAHVYGFDLAVPATSANAICGDYTALPFQTDSVDLIFSNLMLHWSHDADKTLQEFKRILKPDGLLLFTTVGPDTLYELRESFASASTGAHVHTFVDMHNVGDALLKQGFSGPVMDLEYLSIEYTSADQLWRDLKGGGLQNALTNRSRGLMGKHAFARMLAHYQTLQHDNGRLPATIELIYGHAWGAAQARSSSTNSSGEVVVPLHVVKEEIKNG